METVKNNPIGIEKAAQCIREGKLVVWPSIVWYGLCTNAHNPESVGRLYRAKRRDQQEALLMLTLGIDDARRYGEFNDIALRLVERFWPGFLGVIVKKNRESVPDFVTAGKDSVLLASLDGLGYDLPYLAGVPVVSSSCNISGTPPAISMDEVREFVCNTGDRIDVVIEGPISPINRPTTIVDTTVIPPKIIREGVVHERSIRKVVPQIVIG